jgi:hypothetical protein
MSDRTRYDSANVPDAYHPITIGLGDYVAELSVSSPPRYTIGFTTPKLPQEVLELVPDRWVIVEQEFVTSAESASTEYMFVEVGGSVAMTPNELAQLISDNDAIRYAVPVYSGEEYGLEAFTPIPNHVVVTFSDLDNSMLPDIDEAFVSLDQLAADQGFFPLLYRDSMIGRRLRRLYSSLVTEPAMAPNEEFFDYAGEPGAALLLVDQMRDSYESGDVDLVAELDWFVSNPNDLGTSATQVQEQPIPTIPRTQEIVSQAAVKVAVLDGEFDLNHASSKLPFGYPRRNETSNTSSVGVTNGHAHGTLCAGIIGAQQGIEDWSDGGVASDVQLIPISIYRTLEPVRAELQDLVDGINFALSVGCQVLSISVAGFPAAFSLINAVQGAEDIGAVIIAGTGNRREEEPGAAGFVQYPAAFGTVIGVGAAMLDWPDQQQRLNRISLSMSRGENERAVWESRYGAGIDVVAPGLLVTSTDISDDIGANESASPGGDLWNMFSGTSAATPLIAGFAAIIASRTGASPQGIRDEIRATADLHGSYVPETMVKGNGWHREVGCGWIDRDMIDSWQPANEPTIPTDEIGTNTRGDEPLMTDQPNATADSVIICGSRDNLSNYSESTVYPYAGKFSDAVRPLADFFASLASGGEFCGAMAIHFWRDPYLTARIAGLPWQAAVLLGSGDWKAVYEAIDAEYHAITDRPAGPIWVRTR